MQLTQHFTLEELTQSVTARNRSIDNTPNKSELANLRLLAESVLEPLRHAYGKPIVVSSGSAVLPSIRLWVAHARRSTCWGRLLTSMR